MGSKTGLADEILDLLGLVPGEGAGRYLWAEIDEGCRRALGALADPALAAEASEILLGWLDEDARALWTRLRDAPAITDHPAADAARWVALSAGTRGGNPGGGGFKGRHRHRPRVDGFIPSRSSCAARLLDLPPLPATLFADAEEIDPVEVVASARSPSDVFVYVDPPYRGVTGYQRDRDLDRAGVVRLALAWAEVGAVVAVSGAEPIAALSTRAWPVVEVTALRRGQGRTFSKQQREFVTLSRLPRSGAGRC